MKVVHSPSLVILLSFVLFSTAVAQSLIPGQSVATADGTLVTYHLTVKDTTVNFTGKPTPALATNGQIPAPTLYFTEGDTAQMIVTNATNETVSFHWHGLLLPNQYDGVPLLNTDLIKPGDIFEFKFPVIQNGTYWYHSHTEFQEQKGQYGAIVIQPRVPIATKEKVVVLSDFTTQKPWEVLRQLKKHNDWYAIRRNAVQSYGKALVTGNLGAQAWLEWNRMPAMDLADVYYDAFLANGKLEDNFTNLQAGEPLRLRIVNGSASSHFWLHFSGGKFNVVAADGIDIEPIEVDKLLIATAEVYDIEVVLPENRQYEFRATSWDRYKHTSIWIGQGIKEPATALPPINYYELVNEMKGMMKMMPDMTMGKAPAERPETTLYQPGTAPTYEQIEMKAMQEMGMDMPMNRSTEHHDKQEMPDHQGNKMPHGQHETPPTDKMEENQSEMKGMEKMNQSKKEAADSNEGTTYKADEMDSKTMDMPMDMNMGHGSGQQPKGVMMTGYKQLQEAFPDETFFNYNMLRAKQPTVLSENAPVRIVHLYLTGNMLRYIWMMNNKALSESDKIMIKQGEVVRFVFHNTTMMSHPMHLHGHFFRVINSQGAYAPLKHTVNVAPMETTIIEFAATEDRDWFFHCHLLYHMMSGMARIIGYENSEVKLSTQQDYDKFALDDTKWFPMANAAVQSNGYWADISVFNMYNEISVEGDGNYQGEYDIEGKLMRYFGPKQFLTAYIGTELEPETTTPTDGENSTTLKAVGLLGLRYFLPMHVWSDIRIDHEGRFQLELEREDIPLTKRWRMAAGAEYNFTEKDIEYTIGTTYIIGQYLGISGNYDSDYGWGLGVKVMY